VLFDSGAVHSDNAYLQHLAWLHRQTRLFLRPPMIAANLDDTDSDDDINDPYDRYTREGVQPERAPLERHVVS
jgi:hypothetical protein